MQSPQTTAGVRPTAQEDQDDENENEAPVGLTSATATPGRVETSL